jgi:hypothetical protein
LFADAPVIIPFSEQSVAWRASKGKAPALAPIAHLLYKPAFRAGSDTPGGRARLTK